jgi:hypothetical protein
LNCGGIGVSLEAIPALTANDLARKWVTLGVTRIVFLNVLLLGPLRHYRTSSFEDLPTDDRLMMVFHVKLVTLSVVGMTLKAESE